MNHPQIGERVRILPLGRKVQRGEAMYGQFIAEQGEELLWDPYLHMRWTEGAIAWEPLKQKAPAEPAPEVVDDGR